MGENNEKHVPIVGRFVLEFNHSAPQEALSSQPHGFNYHTSAGPLQAGEMEGL